MANDTITMLGPDGGTYLVPKANHAAALQSGMKTAPLAQQAMPPQPSLSMKRQEFLRKQAPNLTPEAIGSANKTAAMVGASLLPIGATEGAAVTKGIPWAARQAAERIPSAYGGYEAGSAATQRISKDTGMKIPPVVGGAAGAAAGFFAPELIKGAVNKAVPLVEKLGAAWRGGGKVAEGAGSALAGTGRVGSAGDLASFNTEDLWANYMRERQGANPDPQLMKSFENELARRGAVKAGGMQVRPGGAGEPVATQAGKTVGVSQPLSAQVADFAQQGQSASRPAENQVAELRQMQNNQVLRNMRKQNTLKTFSGALEEGRKHAKATGEIK